MYSTHIVVSVMSGACLCTPHIVDQSCSVLPDMSDVGVITM